MPKPSIDDIIIKVKEAEDASLERRERMDSDYALWQLTLPPANASLDPEDPGIGRGYKQYISNEPRTYGQKVVSIAASSQLVVRVKGGITDTKEKRAEQNAKEKFLIGVFRAADERLTRMMQPLLQDQLSFYGPIRGWIAVRALLRKRKDGSTFVDIQPLDPRNTYWGMGKEGLDDAWVVTKTFRTPNEIKSMYGVEVEGSNFDDQGVAVYDYVDADGHLIATEDKTLQAWTKHGSPRTPIFIGPVGETPVISDKDGTHSKDVGESIYASVRATYPHHNFVMSVILELMGRARSPGTRVYSQDGNKTLDDDPFKAGAEVSLRTGIEEIKPLDQIETTKDAQLFAGFLSGELQRGSLPHSVYGELQFQLSGFAINSLRQGVATIVQPSIKAINLAYNEIAKLLVDQYVTGAFKPMELAGTDRNREFFSEEITPEMVKEAGGHIEIEVLPELPQDEPAKMQMAQLARTPDASGKPLMSDRQIREDILQMQDPDAAQLLVNEQIMESATPLAQAFSWMMTAAELGRDDLANIYMDEIMTLMRDKLMMEQAKQQAVAGAGAPAGPPPGPPGIPADVVPSQAQGVPQSEPVPQQGPLVPQGTPRPGAQNGGVSTADVAQ